LVFLTAPAAVLAAGREPEPEPPTLEEIFAGEPRTGQQRCRTEDGAVAWVHDTSITGMPLPEGEVRATEWLWLNGDLAMEIVWVEGGREPTRTLVSSVPTVHTGSPPSIHAEIGRWTETRTLSRSDRRKLARGVRELTVTWSCDANEPHPGSVL
jgi:hypothetical protein